MGADRTVATIPSWEARIAAGVGQDATRYVDDLEFRNGRL
jgi:hypothetical protein